MVLCRPTRPSRNNTPKYIFVIGNWNTEIRSQEIPGNRQIWPWNTKGSRANANRVCQESALVIVNTLFQQHKRRLHTWTLLDGQYQSQIDYIPCIQRWRSLIQSARTRLGSDCGSDHELLIAKFRPKLKKIRENH